METRKRMLGMKVSGRNSYIGTVAIVAIKKSNAEAVQVNLIQELESKIYTII
jgi:hypothetical protein